MIEIPCGRCGGRGKIKLSTKLDSVLQAVKSGHQTVESVRAAGNSTVLPTAINNRLERLRELGLIKRHREGRFFHYKPTNKKRK